LADSGSQTAQYTGPDALLLLICAFDLLIMWSRSDFRTRRWPYAV